MRSGSSRARMVFVCSIFIVIVLIGLHVHAARMCGAADTRSGLVGVGISLASNTLAVSVPFALGSFSGSNVPGLSVAAVCLATGAVSSFVVASRLSAWSEQARGELDRGAGARAASQALFLLGVTNALCTVLYVFVLVLSLAVGDEL